ncbi:CCA tRNA nucleotidyltransferase [Novosphingobium sp.]|uniref:CCA tRNA nucleotidyltransferase n=1 Tax=Novosphingobium sp. TaxID=1874826 RepID=UPI0025EC6DEF|nr:CCA tRNA nucleotidyltransferase [Novosphingobium sp.]
MTAQLAPSEWTSRADLAALFAALDPEGNTARYVGGAVRDTLLGVAVKDIDVATQHEPGEVIARLKAASIRTVPTGIAHGTITALLDGGPAEITTLRRDVSTDGRRATVAFSRRWQDDAARRDFTINALYADPRSLEISDWFGGMEDLNARRVRFIGEASDRIREDYLRILRYFRFQARFGALPADASAEAACAELAPGMKALSRERVGWELQLLLGLPDPAQTIARMAELGVLREVLPEVAPDGLVALTTLVAEEQRQQIAPQALRRMAALLPTDPALAEQVAARLRLSIAQRKRLASAADRDGKLTEPRALAWAIGRDSAIDRLLLTGCDTKPLADWESPYFPLKGGTIMARGVDAGPEIARMLRRIEARWVEEGFPDANRIEDLLTDELARRNAL